MLTSKTFLFIQFEQNHKAAILTLGRLKIHVALHCHCHFTIYDSAETICARSQDQSSSGLVTTADLPTERFHGLRFETSDPVGSLDTI